LKKIRRRRKPSQVTKAPSKGVPLSLVMIIKNEEDRLETCLESVLPYVPDAYVLDTGSTDSSPDILARMAVKYPHLRYDIEPWEGTWHFSNARNKASEKAKHNYVLVLDGDEELHNGEALGALNPQGNSVVAFDIECIGHAEVSNHLRSGRVYDRTRCYWKGRVHNQLLGDRSVVYSPGPLVVSHYKGKIAEKAARSIPLLELQVDEGDEFEREAAKFFLAKTYFVVQDWSKCVEYAEPILEEMTPDQYHQVEVVVWCAYANLFLRGAGKMKDVLDKGVALFPDSPHINQALVAYHLVVWAGMAKSPRVQMKYSLAGLTPLKFAPRLGQVADALGIPLDIDSVKIG
jgi:glycosyltransferase involved in cell wall biosynthesis